MTQKRNTQSQLQVQGVKKMHSSYNRSTNHTSEPVIRGQLGSTSFKDKLWVRTLSCVLSVLLAVTMFDLSGLSPLVEAAQAANPAAEQRATQDASDGAADSSSPDANADASADQADANDATSQDVDNASTGEGQDQNADTQADTTADDDATAENATDDTDTAEAEEPEAPVVSVAEVQALDLEDSALTALLPQNLVASDKVLPAPAQSTDKADIAARTNPLLATWGVPYSQSGGYLVGEGRMQSRYELGNLGELLEGGYLAGTSEQDAFVLSLDIPYLFDVGQDALGTTLSQEEWRLRTARAELAKDATAEDTAQSIANAAIEKAKDETLIKDAPRVALFAEDELPDWSVWVKHGDAYQKATKEDLQLGVTGHVILRYEGGTNDAHDNGKLDADAVAPEFELGFVGNVNDNNVIKVAYGVEAYTFTDRDGNVERGNGLRTMLGSLVLSTGTTKAVTEMSFSATGLATMIQRDGEGSGYATALATYAVPEKMLAAQSIALAATFNADWRGLGGLTLADLMAFRSTDEGAVANLTEAGEVDTTKQTREDNQFVGVAGEAGLLVFDVTGLTDAQIAALDPTNAKTFADAGLEPLPYYVTEDAQARISLTEGSGRVEQNAKRTLYVAVPYRESALALYDENDPKATAPEDPNADFEPVFATFDLQASVLENNSPVLLTERADATFEFAAKPYVETPALPGVDGSDKPTTVVPDSQLPSIPSSKDEGEGTGAGEGEGADDSATEAPVIGTEPGNVNLSAGRPLFSANDLINPLDAGISAHASIDFSQAINPFITLNSENEAIPGAVDTYLIKGTGDPTFVTLDATFPFKSGWLGSQKNPAMLYFNVPYLYFDKNGAVMSCYTKTDYDKAMSDNAAYNNPNAPIKLAATPPSNLFVYWELVNETGTIIRSQEQFNRLFPDGTLTGSFKLRYRGGSADFRMGTEFQRPQFEIAFVGSIPENTGATIQIGAEVHNYTPQGGTEEIGNLVIPAGDRTGGVTSSRSMTFIKTNLEWNTTVTNLWRPALWDKYNYMVYQVETTNTSSSVDTLVDLLDYSFMVTNDSRGGGGVRQEDIMTWNADGTPNSNFSPDYPGELVGKPNQGGILIYDATDWTDDVWETIDLDKFSNAEELGLKPLSYFTGGMDGRFSFKIPEERGGKLTPDGYDDNGNLIADNHDHFTMVIAVPYTTNIQPFTMGGKKVYPYVDFSTSSTVYFGGRGLNGYSWTKQLSNSDTFVEPVNNVEVTKEAYNYNTKRWMATGQDAYDRVGYLSSYRLRNLSVTGNMPTSGQDLDVPYGATLNDDLPDDWEPVSIDFRIEKELADPDDPYPDTRTLDEIMRDWLYLDGGLVQFEATNARGQTSWVTLTAAPTKIDSGVDGNKEYAVWRVGGASATDGIAAQLEKQGVAAKPRNSIITTPLLTFTGNMRFLMAKEIHQNQVMPGEITVNGIMRAPSSDGVSGRFTNTVQPLFGRKQWAVKVGDEGNKYYSSKQTGAESQAHLVAIGPVVPTVQAYTYDQKGKTWSGLNGTVNAPLNNARNGYVFNLSNPNPSMIEPGTFSTSDIAFDTRNGVRGFEADYVMVSAGLLAKSDITELRLYSYQTGSSSPAVVLSPKDMAKYLVDASGNTPAGDTFDTALAGNIMIPTTILGKDRLFLRLEMDTTANIDPLCICFR